VVVAVAEVVKVAVVVVAMVVVAKAVAVVAVAKVVVIRNLRPVMITSLPNVIFFILIHIQFFS
jgi:hypothetical protein